MATSRKPQQPAKQIDDLNHPEATRTNIPSMEYQALMADKDKASIKVRYPRGKGTELAEEKAQRDKDQDPQLVWRGKDKADSAELTVHAPPLYIQEKVKPKALIDELCKVSSENGSEPGTADLFEDFNGLPKGAQPTDFYQYEGHWQNRLILGDSLQVMATLAERERLRGKVQCIYFDPPYGIKFNSNFQWSTTSRDVKDGRAEHITREPEQVKAFRDTWRDGIHSYLTYLRDRLIVARDLLAESGSIFVQIGDENVHRVRCLMDEVFGEDNFISQVMVWKTSSQTASFLSTTTDYIIWFARNKEKVKFRQLYSIKDLNDASSGAAEYKYFWNGFGSFFTEKEHEKNGLSLPRFRPSPTTSQSGSETTRFTFEFAGRSFSPGTGGWKTNLIGFDRLAKADRLIPRDKSISYVRFLDDFGVVPIADLWTDVRWGFDASEKRYVVETNPRVIQRCILMSTDPGDLVLDPTCGSGTTAYVAEQWGRRWITMDTSRVALALARARLMGARYPYYLLADSPEGELKRAELSGRLPSPQKTFGNNVSHGFVCQRVPHITLKSIANNEAIDGIWQQYQEQLEPLREKLNQALKKHWQEWEIPREADKKWSAAAQALHKDWWARRIERQQAIDGCIAERAEYETLYDKPYEDTKRVRVAGPFTVESVSPHRSLTVDENDALQDTVEDTRSGEGQDFAAIILQNLKTAGVQQAHKQGKIDFSALNPWPGRSICAEGHYAEEGKDRRAGIFIGGEFATVSRADLVDAAREARDAGFDALIACAFHFESATSDVTQMGALPVLKARMNADLHMAEDLKNTGKGNLFVIFGEPDVDILDGSGQSLLRCENGRQFLAAPTDGQLVVHIKGVDVFDPNKGEIRSQDTDGIACWFVDTDYSGESFFVRHAYFLGANDPYKALKTTLKADINASAWQTLHSAASRPFPCPKSKRFAVKVINHLGDEVMKVFKVEGS